MITRRTLGFAIAGSALSLPGVALAGECDNWRSGQCVAYVNSRISPRQSGDGGSWPANLPASEVRAGDVAIFRSYNHVAYVEEVTRRDAQGRPSEIRVSEMNWGQGLRPDAPPNCVVTTKYGIRTERPVAVGRLEFMRPGGYRPAPIPLPSPGVGATAHTTPQTAPRRKRN